MRRILLATTTLGALALVVATAGLGERGERNEKGGSLSDVSVCGSASFSVGSARCIVDESGGVRSGDLHCSARTKGLAGTAYTGTFTYRGRQFPVQTGVVRGDGWVYTRLSIKGGSFPAGEWSCRIGAGGSVTGTSFVTTGASGTLTSAAACDTSATVASSSVRACRRDQSARPLASTSRITCSGVYGLANGRSASAELLYEGRSTGLALTRTLPLPVSMFGMQVARPGGLPAGDYTCVFRLDGKAVGTRAFSIGA